MLIHNHFFWRDVYDSISSTYINNFPHNQVSHVQFHHRTKPLPSPTAPEVEAADQEEGTAAEGAVEDTAEGAPEDSTQNTPEDSTKEERPQEATLSNDNNTAEESGEERAEPRKQWSQEELLNLSRKFNLDLAPKVSLAGENGRGGA